MELLSDNLERNIAAMRELFFNDAVFKERYVGDGAWLCFLDGMVSGRTINENIISPMQSSDFLGLSAAEVCRRCFSACEVLFKADFESICGDMSTGDTALFIEGLDVCIVIDTKGWSTRGISEPENERVIRGPREGFNESLLGNLALLRRRLPSNKLKTEFVSLGRLCKSRVCIVWYEGQVDERVLAGLRKKLAGLDIALPLDSNLLQECMKDCPRTPFKTVGATERPDTLASKLLEGRVALLTEGSPTALTLPHLFVELFQTGEDYYVNYIYASFQRLLRTTGFWLSICLPAVYLALACYQPAMLPRELVASIIEAREGVPFHTASEMIILLLIFDLLRESGARASANVGPALSVVSSIVLGQAAIEAKLVGAPVLIVVAFSGVTGVLIPRLSAVVIAARYALLLLTAVFGTVGLAVGVMSLLLHIASLESAGTPYLGYGFATSQRVTGDSALRASWRKLSVRRIFPKQ